MAELAFQLTADLAWREEHVPRPPSGSPSPSARGSAQTFPGRSSSDFLLKRKLSELSNDIELKDNFDQCALCLMFIAKSMLENGWICIY